MMLGGYYDTLNFLRIVYSKYQGANYAWFPPRYLGRIVHLALAEKLVEKLAGFPFVILNIGAFSISLAPCVVQHGVQQIMFNLPFFRLCELIEELVGVRLGRSIEIERITKFGRKYDGIMRRSFSLICIIDFRLLLLDFLRGSSLRGGATSVLSPAARWNYFHLSFDGGIRSGLSLRRSRLRSSVGSTWRNWCGGAYGRRCPEKARDWLLGSNPRSSDLLVPVPSKEKT
jgi:hypothetical protein